MLEFNIPANKVLKDTRTNTSPEAVSDKSIIIVI